MTSEEIQRAVETARLALAKGWSLLVRDRRPDAAAGDPVERRRADCARLAACETAWCAQADRHAAHAQARCPPKCGGFAARAAS